MGGDRNMWKLQTENLCHFLEWTILSNKITRNIIVPSFKANLRKLLRRRPTFIIYLFGEKVFHIAIGLLANWRVYRLFLSRNQLQLRRRQHHQYHHEHENQKMQEKDGLTLRGDKLHNQSGSRTPGRPGDSLRDAIIILKQPPASMKEVQYGPLNKLVNKKGKVPLRGIFINQYTLGIT